MKSMDILYKKTTVINMITGGFLFLGLWLNMNSIFRFMPPEYRAANYAFFFLALGRYIDLATGLNTLIIISSKRYRFDLWFTLSLVAVIVALNLVFIPIYGITGASIATLIGGVLVNGLRLIFVQYFFKLQPFTTPCIWIFIITMAVWGITALIPAMHNKYIDIAVKSSVITALYGSAIVLLKLSPDVNAVVYKYTKLKFLAPTEDKA